jgi:undecaprenyl-diphosphatase
VTSNRSIVLYAGAAALALLWFAMFLQGTGDADRAILAAFYAGDRHALASAARLVTFLGGGYFVTPVVAAVALAISLRGRPWRGLVLFVGTTAGRLLVELQKQALGRLRPDENPHLVDVHNLSFPSGHSANAMMVYVVIAWMLAEGPNRAFWLGAALLLSILIGLSRVMLGVHWPSDVVGGWSFGLLWAVLLVRLAKHPPKRRARR